MSELALVLHVFDATPRSRANTIMTQYANFYFSPTKKLAKIVHFVNYNLYRATTLIYRVTTLIIVMICKQQGFYFDEMERNQN